MVFEKIAQAFALDAEVNSKTSKVVFHNFINEKNIGGDVHWNASGKIPKFGTVVTEPTLREGPNGKLVFETRKVHMPNLGFSLTYVIITGYGSVTTLEEYKGMMGSVIHQSGFVVESTSKDDASHTGEMTVTIKSLKELSDCLTESDVLTSILEEQADALQKLIAPMKAAIAAFDTAASELIKSPHHTYTEVGGLGLSERLLQKTVGNSMQAHQQVSRALLASQGVLHALIEKAITRANIG